MRILLFTISIILLLSCNHRNEMSLNKLIAFDSLESEKQKVTIITDTSQVKWIIEDYNSLWIPTHHQLNIIDSILNKAMLVNTKSYYRRFRPDSLDSFYRQLICYTTNEGDSLIYINALCHIHDYPVIDSNDIIVEMRRADWQHNIIEVMDGGDCFWRILIDIRKRTYKNLMVNGVA